MKLKKVWINDTGRKNYSITFESANPKELWNRILVGENVFPAEPTKEHPLRQTVNLGNFDIEDLRLIQYDISKIISNNCISEAFDILCNIYKYADSGKYTQSIKTSVDVLNYAQALFKEENTIVDDIDVCPCEDFSIGLDFKIRNKKLSFSVDQFKITADRFIRNRDIFTAWYDSDAQKIEEFIAAHLDWLIN